MPAIEQLDDDDIANCWGLILSQKTAKLVKLSQVPEEELRYALCTSAREYKGEVLSLTLQVVSLGRSLNRDTEVSQ